MQESQAQIIADLQAETDFYKKQYELTIRQKEQEIAKYRSRVARLEEQLKGDHDTELD